MLAEQVRAARMNGQPVAENAGQKRRQRNVPGRPLLPRAFLLADQDSAGLEINVGNLDAQQLAPPCPRVCSGAAEGVDPRLRGVLSEVGEELLDLLLAEI